MVHFSSFFLAITATAGAAEYPAGGSVHGVALNGLLQLEDWFFSYPEGMPPYEAYPFNEVKMSNGVQVSS